MDVNTTDIPTDMSAKIMLMINCVPSPQLEVYCSHIGTIDQNCKGTGRGGGGGGGESVSNLRA